MERKRYDAIDGLRTIACIGIVMMNRKQLTKGMKKYDKGTAMCQ